MSRETIERNKRIRIIGILAIGAAAILAVLFKALMGS
jgi:hypothetical protein